jgi:hypothetical protein
MPCPANPSQSCGGADRINIYKRPEPPTCTRVTIVDPDLITCGLRGFQSAPSTYSTPAAEGCAALCAPAALCRSFSWNKATKECALWGAKTWEWVQDVTPAGRAGGNFKDVYAYDIRCWSCV